jgi:uncharacterized protein (DUF1499 family)
MKYITSIILFLVIAVCLLLSLTLFRNQAHVFTRPGVVERLKVYLTQNSAQTAVQPLFPELRSGDFQVSAQTLYNAVQSALLELGWTFSLASEKNHHGGEYRIHAVVTTALFKFKDDVMVRIHHQHCQHGRLYSLLDISSKSRVGKADFAANAGHIQRLLQQVELELDHQIPARPQSPPCQ